MTTVYRGMDRPTLDAAYNNTKVIPNFPEVLADFQSRSATLYERAVPPAKKSPMFRCRGIRISRCSTISRGRMGCC